MPGTQPPPQTTTTAWSGAISPVSTTATSTPTDSRSGSGEGLSNVSSNRSSPSTSYHKHPNSARRGSKSLPVNTLVFVQMVDAITQQEQKQQEQQQGNNPDCQHHHQSPPHSPAIASQFERRRANTTLDYKKNRLAALVREESKKPTPLSTSQLSLLSQVRSMNLRLSFEDEPPQSAGPVLPGAISNTVQSTAEAEEEADIKQRAMRPCKSSELSLSEELAVSSTAGRSRYTYGASKPPEINSSPSLSAQRKWSSLEAIPQFRLFEPVLTSNNNNNTSNEWVRRWDVLHERSVNSSPSSERRMKASSACSLESIHEQVEDIKEEDEFTAEEHA